MSTTSPLPGYVFSALPSWQGSLPGSGEFAALLNAISDAALVIDHDSGKMAFANRGFFELTGLSPFESSLPAAVELLPELQNGWSSGEERETRLHLPGGKSLAMWLNLTWLDKPGRWQLARLIPEQVYRWRAAQMRREDQWLEALEGLADLTNKTDTNAAFQSALEIGQNLLGAESLSIYRADVKLLLLERAQTLGPHSELLPASLGLERAALVYAPSLWLNGQRAVTELQQAARVNNLESLVSAPIEMDGQRLGLLVAINLPPINARQLIEVLNLLAAHMAAALQHYATLNSLNRAVRESRRALAIQEAIGDNTSDGILLLHPSLKVMNLNTAAEMMLGYSRQEAIGSPVQDILIGAEHLSAGLRMALQGLNVPGLGNLRLHRRAGQTFPAEAQVVPVMVKDEVEALVLLLRDKSEGEQIRARTQQLEQRALLGEITAIFAHEVRNPINNISTGLQLLEMGLPEQDPNRDLTTRLQADCGRLTHLMESVLAFSKPMEYLLRPTPLRPLLEALLERWKPRMSRLNVTLAFQGEEELPAAQADPRALEQVFTNLISNALNAMREQGGILAVRVEKTQEAGKPQLRVDISDTGPGIPPELRSKIFEPFFTTSAQGTGLGLAITQRIVLAHKGKIEVESFPGGTIFSICLPVSAPTGEEQ